MLYKDIDNVQESVFAGSNTSLELFINHKQSYSVGYAFRLTHSDNVTVIDHSTKTMGIMLPTLSEESCLLMETTIEYMRLDLSFSSATYMTNENEEEFSPLV